MTSAMTKRTVTAFFDSRSEAERAVDRLAAEGLSRDEVRLVPGQERDVDNDRGQGGTSAGGGTGFWASLRDLFLPDEDRHTYAEGLRRGGYLVSVTTTEANHERVLDILDDEGTIDIDERASEWRSQGWSGHAAGGALGSTAATMGMGSSSTDYDRTTSTGADTHRTVTATTTDHDRAGSTGGMSGALARASDAVSEAFAGSDRDRTGTGTGTAGATTGTGLTGAGAATGADRDAEVIPVVEEQLQVGKRAVEHGRVRVRSYVTEQPVSEQVSLRQEHVHVERRSVDRPVTAADEALFQERTIEATEQGEEAVVSKQARVTEEVVVNKTAEERSQTVQDTVRRTEVEVDDERTGAGRTGSTGTTGSPGSRTDQS